MSSATEAPSIAYKGITMETLINEAGSKYGDAVETAGKDIKRRRVESSTLDPNPARHVGDDVYQHMDAQRGTKPHRSSRDKTDEKNVITVGYYTKRGTRYMSIHAHEDGSWKEFLSRAVKLATKRARTRQQMRRDKVD